MPSAEAAELSAQMDLYTELFNRLTRSCSAKCLALKNTEGELSKGESVCLDRCARKYMDTNVAVGQAMAVSRRVGGQRSYARCRMLIMLVWTDVDVGYRKCRRNGTEVRHRVVVPVGSLGLARSEWVALDRTGDNWHHRRWAWLTMFSSYGSRSSRHSILSRIAQLAEVPPSCHCASR